MTVRLKSVLKLLIALVISAGLIAFRSLHQAETIIEGKAVSAWAQELANPNFDDPGRVHAFDVLAGQPPAIIPELLKCRAQIRVTARVERALGNFGRKIGLVSERVNWNFARRDLLRVISQIAKRNGLAWETRPEAQAAVDELMRELKADPTNTPMYAYRLADFGINATNALPTLIQFIPTASSATNPPEEILMLLTAIADIGPGPYAPQVIRAATNLLSSGKRMNIDAALRALGACGTDASPFIPQIAEHAYDGEAAISALAEIGQVPLELKPHLANWMKNGSVLGPAAVAMLKIDPKEPTALDIVQARLHPGRGLDVPGGRREHTEMIQLIARVPTVAKLFVPELEKLARMTNEPTSKIARWTLRGLAVEAK